MDTPWRTPRLLVAGVLGVAAAAACAAEGPAGSGSTPGSPAAEAFIALSGGDRSSTVPWSDRVAYYVGDALVGVLSRDALPQALRSCPAGTVEYEGRPCPVSPLDTVAAASAPPGASGGSGASGETGVVVEPSAPDTVGCTRLAGPPPGTAGLVATSVRPVPTRRDCFGDFAVTLFTDATGRVVVLRFVLSGP